MKTPQLSAMPGMTPLGLKLQSAPAHTPTMREALEEMIIRYDLLDKRLVNGQHDEPNGTIERARLALAADPTPELVAALQMVIEFIPTLPLPADHTARHNRTAIKQVIRAALAKARGEA